MSRQEEEQSLALDDLKVVEFGRAVAGPLTGKYLADYGACVVKVESYGQPDLARLVAPFKDNRPGSDRSYYFANFNSSKLAVSFDLHNEKGKELSRRLMTWADVVIDGFAPGVLDRLGLGYADAKEWNPEVIVVALGAWGATGGARHNVAFGQHITAMAGLTDLTGWPETGPVELYGAYTDCIVPRFAIAAVMAAVESRDGGGGGRFLDCSQLETALQLVAPLLLAHEAGQAVATRSGNESSDASPHGVYRCAGDDDWCAISVEFNAEWEALCTTIGKPELARDSRFATLPDRKANEHELNDLLEAWTRDRRADEVMSLLMDAGVSAGSVSDAERMLADPQLESRGHFARVNQGELGDIVVQRLPHRMSSYRHEIRRPAPSLGQDTFTVCTKFLGISDDEFTSLAAAGAFGTDGTFEG
jgi:benzylsuccinate CoA-transferase BbsF subunit